MNAGWYKRRRGILEHIESGAIDLLESGIHDYLSLKANLVIGSPCSIPVGIVFTSAPAIHVHCKHRVSERTVQRCLDHMEQIGWLKFKVWTVPGKRGNYPVLVCRGSVADLSGNEYRINGERTTDWRHPVYEPVGELSGRVSTNGVGLSGNREVRREKEKKPKEKPAAKPAQPQDPRFQGFFSFAYEDYRVRKGQPPAWGGKHKANLKQFLQENPAVSFEEWQRRWLNYSQSTESYTVSQGRSLAHFCSRFDSFIDGPVVERRLSKGGIGHAASIDARNLAAAGFKN